MGQSKMFFYLKTLTIKNSLQIEASKTINDIFHIAKQITLNLRLIKNSLQIEARKTIKDIFQIRHMSHEMLNQISSHQMC